jgi:hypothetical protein
LEFGVDVHGVDVVLAAAALGCDVAVAKTLNGSCQPYMMYKKGERRAGTHPGAASHVVLQTPGVDSSSA